MKDGKVASITSTSVSGTGTGKSSKDLDKRSYILKIVILGEISVGKSNIIRRILSKDFQTQEATIGVEFGDIEVGNVDRDNPNITLKLQIWDTSGAERYRAITTSHIRNADGAIVVYDVTNEASFKALSFWLDSIKSATSSDIVIYILGNKADLKESNKDAGFVSQRKVEEFARKNGVKLVTECSALTNKNISQTFESFYRDVYYQQKEMLEQKVKERIQFLDNRKRETSTKGCC